MTNSPGVKLHSQTTAGPKGEGMDSPSNFPRYPEYKDSGVEWLGEVPEHWQVLPAKYRIASESGGQTTKNTVADEQSEGLFPAFSASGQDIWTPDFDYDRDGIVLSAVGARCGKTFKANGKWAVVANTHCLFPGSDADRDFLWYLTNREEWWERGGTAQPFIKVSDTLARKWVFPAVPEQTAIAAFLDRETGKIDALVAEQEKLIALLKEKRQAVISHAVTKGLNPDAPMKPSGIEWLGDVPAHWEVLRIGALFKEVVEVGGDDLPILSVSIHDGVSDKELDEAEMDRKVTRSEDRSKYKAVRPGDLAYNMMRAWQGGFGAVTVFGQVSPAYVVARPLREICTEFVEQLLRTPQAVEQMRRYSRGITDFRLRLYWEEFKNLRIAVPAVTEQRAILEAIAIQTAMFGSLTAQAEDAITLLIERRSALISAAVTGQIDVRAVAGCSN